VALDEAFVPSTQRLRIGRSNFRLPSDIQSKESTLQVVYDVLRNSPFFRAFLVTADVPEIYMQEFWATAKLHHNSIHFKMDTKKSILDLEAFREMLHISHRIPSRSLPSLDETELIGITEMLHICPRIHGQSFDELPFEEDILDFIRFLRHSATIRTLNDININKLYQPWRSFAPIINKCLTGKSSGYDSFRLSQAQILWGLYHKRNIDYAFLNWEDFVYQVEHKNHKKSNKMYYPRFTKVIIHYFMSKDPSIPRRNKINWHYVRDESIFSTIKVVSKHQNTQQYGAMLPIELTNDEIRNIKAYKEYYAFATGEAAPKPKASARRKRSGSDTSITPPIATTTPKTTVVVTPKKTAATKGKQPAKAKSLSNPSKPSGSGTNEGTGSKPGVPDVPTDESEEELSWNSYDDEGVDDQEKVDDDDEGDEGHDSEEGEKDDKIDDEEDSSDEEDDNEETRDEESFDPIPQTPKSSEDEGDGEEYQSLKIGEEERLNEEEEADELYRNVDINQGRGLQVNQEVEDSHVILTPINSDGQREDDDQEGPSAGSDRGSKRRREGAKHASASTPTEPATRSACRSTTGSQSRQPSASESALVEEPVQPTCQIEEPSHPVFKTGADDQPIIQTTQHPEWFSQPRRPPTPDQEVYKATTDQLDWVNPKGQQYPHNLLQPLPLIPDNQGRSVIPFEHFINNNHEYLRGGDLKRLRIQDIEDMLLLLVHGKLSNLTVEERFTFNVSLRMFTRSIVIQRHVEDLQRGVESYQKRLNLTKPDTY
nr:hypothetical protein [Tanacetum cinerariifolium]